MKTIKNLFTAALIVCSLIAVAQKKEANLIDFGDEKITKAEFIRVYKKNNSGEMVSKSTVDEYLDLYINFKLKVKEATAKGMDTLPEFINELSGYRKQLAQPYLSADGIIEELKKEAYERLKQDVRVSHILISVSEDASPEDTLAAYKKAEKVKSLLEAGEDFEKVAKLYSDDPSVNMNQGDLGYFTAFYMVYPFESAAYNTEEGEISEVVRTKFGYHVLKVIDKREAVGNITVAHILISSDPELAKTEDPEGKIKEIYKKIKAGATFEDMAAEFSDDTRSAAQGGRLPTFGVGRMVPEFEAAAFALKKDQDISEPFKTDYGWHIVKRIEKKPIGSFEEVETELTQRVERDSRSNLKDGAILKKIKKEYGFSENIEERNDFYELIDSSYYNNNWKADKAEKYNKVMFTIGDKKVYQSDFTQYLLRTQRKTKAIDFRVLVNSKYESFKNEVILKYKSDKLDEEYPEFKALMQEYHDGILLFNLTNELVWAKAVNDTAGLEAFYEANKENYRWDKRLEAVVFSALNKDIAEETKKLIKDSVELSKIVETINQPSQLNLKYEYKKYQQGENEVVDKIKWEKGISENVPTNGRVSFVYVKEVIEPTYKTLEDSRGMITSDYQEYLEEEWIKSLRVKYEFEVDQKVLKEVKSELN